MWYNSFLAAGTNLSRAQRKHLSNILRLASRALMKGKRGGVGKLGRGASVAAVLAAMGVIAVPNPSLAQYAAGNGVATGVGAVGISGAGAGNATAGGAGAIAIGNGSFSSGTNSIYLGSRSNAGTGALATNAIGIGTDVTSNAAGSIGIGQGVFSTNTNTTAIGVGAKASGVSSVAFGAAASASGTSGISIGNSAVSAGPGTSSLTDNWAANSTLKVYSTPIGAAGVAIGNTATVGLGSVAVGGNSVASGEEGVALGAGSNSTGFTSVAIGAAAQSLAFATIALGNNAQATGLFSTAVGPGAEANGTSSAAFGEGAIVFEASGTAIGFSALAGKKASVFLNDTAIGTNAQATGGNGIAVGDSSAASAQYASALGFKTGASGIGATAIGGNATAGASAAGADSIAIGGQSSVSAAGTSSIAIGKGATVTGASSISIGVGNTVGGANSGAFGDPSIINGANSYSVGNGNTINAALTDEFVLGNNVTLGAAAPSSSVALGSNATLTTGVNTTTVTIGGQTYAGFAGVLPATKGVVSVGSVGGERQIQNVAAGQISASSTDAINGSELFSIVSGINTSGIKYFHTNSVLVDSSATGPNSVAIGGGGTAVTASAAGAVAIGGNATAGAGAAGADSIAIGGQSIANVAGDIAIGKGAAATGVAGTGSATAIGTGNIAKGAGAVAIGDPSVANGTGAIALGFNSIATANGTAGGAAANGAVAIGNADIAFGQGSVAIGNTSTTSGAGQVAIGDSAKVTTSIGLGSVALGSGSTAAAVTATTTYTTANAIVTGKTFAINQAPTNGVVAIGNRQIQGVADGEVSATSTNAINGSQLFATATGLTGNINTLGTGTANALGAGAAYNTTTGTWTAPVFTLPSTGVTTYSSVQLALNALSTGGASSKYFHVNSVLADSAATGTDSVAIGPTAVSGTATIANTVAIGKGATANISAGDIALGSGSVTAATVATLSTTMGATIFSGYAGTTPASTLSIGGVGAERTLTNVAAGRVTATSTDAINGSELFATDTVVAANTAAIASFNSGGGVKYFHAKSVQADSIASGSESVAVGGAALASGPFATAVGTGSQASALDAAAFGGSFAQGKFSTALGFATAVADTSIAIGDNPFANGVGSIAIGGNDPTGVANGAVANGANSIALGSNTIANIANDIAIGTGAVATGVAGTGSATAIGAGNKATGAGAVAIGDPSVANGTGAIALGFNSIATANGTAAGAAANGAVAIGNADIAFGQGSVAIGNTSTTGGVGAVALGDTANAKSANGVAIGSKSVANNANDVALGAGSTTAVPDVGALTLNGGAVAGTAVATSGVVSVGTAAAPRQIQNVAAGVVSATSLDAINGSQLFIVGTAVNSLGNSVATGMGGTSTYSPTTGVVTTGLTLPATGATNYTSVQSALTALSGAGLNFTGDNAATTINVALGGKLPIIGATAAAAGLALSSAAPTAGTYSSANLQVFADATGKQLQVQIADAPVFAGAITSKGITEVAGSVINMGGNVVGGVAAGSLIPASTDAVNGGQVNTGLASVATAIGGTSAFNPVTGKITAGLTLPTTGATPYTDVQSALSALANGGATSKYFHATSVLADSIAVGTDSVAIGPVAVATGVSAVAIGLNANAANAGDVALGSGSKTTTVNNVGPFDLTGGTAMATGPTSVVSIGDVGAERRLTNVAAANLTATSTDAVNGSQLFSVATGLNKLGTTTASTIGGSTTYTAGTGLAGYSTAYAGGAQTTVVGSLDALNSYSTKLAAGTAAAFGGTTAVATDGTFTAPTYALKAGTFNDVGSALAALDTTANAGLNFSGNGGAAFNVVPGGTLPIIGGFTAAAGLALDKTAPTSGIYSSANIQTFADKTTGQIQIQMADNPVFTSVVTGNSKLDTNGLTITGGPSVLVGGINAAGTVITNVAAGSTLAGSTDAVNGGQINTIGTSIAANFGSGATYDPTTGKVLAPTYAVAGGSFNDVGSALSALNGVSSKGLNFTGNDGTAINVALGGTLPIIGGSTKASGLAFNTAAPIAGTYSSANIQTFADSKTGQIQIQMADNAVFTSLTTGNSKLDTNGLTISGGPSVLATGIDAGSKIITNVVAGSTLAGSTDAVNGGQINTIGASIAANFGSGAKYDPTMGKVLAPTYAVAGGSFNDVGSALTALNGVAGAGWNLSTNGGAATNVAPGGTVDLSAGSSNVVMTQSGTKVTVDVAPNLNVVSVTTGNSKLDTTGLTIVGGPSVLATGIDAGGKAITGVAAGVNTTDAVNMGQLNAVSAVAGKGFNMTTGAVGSGTVSGSAVTNVAPGATQVFTAGNNVSITQNGSEVQIATSMTPTFDTVTTSGLKVNAGSSVDMGGNVISNVSMGKAATDVVNVAQLQAAVAAAGTGGSVQYSNANGLTQAAASNDVTLVGTGGPVVIHNVAAGIAATDSVNVGQLAAASPGKWQASTSSNFVLGNANGATPNAPVTISNLAAATLSSTSTEAVNGSQLFATNEAINNLAGITNGLQNQISANKQAARAGTASAMALGMIRYDDRPGKLSLGMAGAVYGGQSGIAVGAGYTSEDMRLRASLGGTFAPANPDADFGVGGSLTWTFN